MQSLRRRVAIGLLAAWALAAPAAAQSTGDIDGTRLTHLVDVDGAAQASVTITGPFSGTITFKVQHRNRAPVVVDCFTPAAPTTAVNSTTGTGSWSCPVAGFHFLEVQFSSYSSGTATIYADTSNGGPAVVGGAGGGGSFDGLLLDAAGGDPITDTTNDALRVNCAVGCSAATSDADDASIAVGQTNSNSNALNQVYDGSVWRRLTIGTAGTASAQVLTVQGIAAMTPLLVTASATNLDVQIGGSDTVTVTGTVTANLGATDNAVLDDIADGIVANAGTNLNTSALLTTAAFQTAFGTGSVVSGDPCDGGVKLTHVINTSTATTVEIANAVSGQFFYICSINISVAGAQTVALVEDDTDGVGSPTAGLNGGTSAATGWSFAANGGIALGNGSGTVMKTDTANRYFGIITGSAVQTSGTIIYVSAP